MDLIALKELRYGGKTIMAGETFEVSRTRDVQTLIAIKRAKLPEPKPEKPAEKKYKTRKLTAEGDDE